MPSKGNRTAQQARKRERDRIAKAEARAADPIAQAEYEAARVQQHAAARERQRREEEALRERLQVEANALQGRAAFLRTLDIECQAHGAVPGVACWAPMDRPAVCNSRAQRAGYTGRVSR